MIDVPDKATELRRIFDQSFAAPAPPSEERENLLAIRLGAHAFALRVREIRELGRCRKLVALPGPLPELLGVAGVRGVAVPVYDLAALLGRGASSEPPRWLVLCGGDEPVALGFHEFEGHIRVLQTELFAPEDREGQRVGVAQVARGEHGVRAVIGLTTLLENIRGRVAAAGASRER